MIKIIQLSMALIILLSWTFSVQAKEVDVRFNVHINNSNASPKEAMTLALPVLWNRVVPTESLEKVARLKGRTSLVLQFKKVSAGMDLIFNPIQVKAYLRGFGISMIPVRPNWKLSVFVLGFSEAEKHTLELMDYSYSVADNLGFELSPRGKKLQLAFTPVTDAYGQTFMHVDVQGSFSAKLLSEQDKPLEANFLSYQLQAWMEQILREIRDAYSTGLKFEEELSVMLLTIDSEMSLSSQVMLEQSLIKLPAVLMVTPTLLQKARRQYKVALRNGDDSWVTSWFSTYGLTAIKQPEGAVNQWLVQ